MAQLLPPEVWLNILKYLRPKEIARFALCSRSCEGLTKEPYLWILMLHRRFTAEHISQGIDNLALTSSLPVSHVLSEQDADTSATILAENESAQCDQQIGLSLKQLQDLYRKLATLKFPATEMAITWGDDQRYWRRESDPYSQNGSVMRVISVWWFHVSGNISFVPRGYYQPVWHLKISSFDPANIGQIAFSARVDDNAANEEHPNSCAVQELGAIAASTNELGWFELRLPVIDVGASWKCAEFVNVAFAAVQHTSNKQGLFLSHFELRPVDALPIENEVSHFVCNPLSATPLSISAEVPPVPTTGIIRYPRRILPWPTLPINDLRSRSSILAPQLNILTLRSPVVSPITPPSQLGEQRERN
ncbi:hypothetical protein BJ742DRAFT_766352 [Cladochytrium replicatum]|nr:hypothetical protein BJ742DRAFT_766352 [Cladochytrium replicatum]